MKHSPTQRVEVYAQAARGLVQLEPDPEKQLKYLDFIDIYSGLDENERERYRRDYVEEDELMSTFAERFRAEGWSQGMQVGMEKGMQRGEVAILVRLLERKFGPVSEPLRRRLETADEKALLLWSDRILTATSLDDIFL
jgi:hypothetical protein